MKKVLLFVGAAALLWSCQPPCNKQYTESGPEIDMIKKGNQAYVAGDWATLRSLYADTAKVADNAWTPDKFIGVDEFIVILKTGLESYSDYKISDDAVYSMITTDRGEQWVLCWFNWTGTTKAGQTVSAPVHLAFRLAGGKVAFQLAAYNQLPGYLAMQPPPPPDATAKK